MIIKNKTQNVLRILYDSVPYILEPLENKNFEEHIGIQFLRVLGEEFVERIEPIPDVEIDIPEEIRTISTPEEPPSIMESNIDVETYRTSPEINIEYKTTSTPEESISEADIEGLKKKRTRPKQLNRIFKPTVDDFLFPKNKSKRKKKC